MLNIHQNKRKLQCTTLTQIAIPLHMETWIQVFFPTPERLLIFTNEGLTAKMSEKTCASGNLTECSSILLLTENTKPNESSGLGVKTAVKGIAVQQGTLPVNLQGTLVHTPQCWESQADFSLSGCPGTQDWITRNKEEKAPITSRTSFFLLLSHLQPLNFSARWEMLCLDFKT